MHRIVESITSLAQHLFSVVSSPERYRPEVCPHCQRAGVWRHGRYHRKADRSVAGALNPVPVLRYFCRACARTCSRLPACIAPRRWYDWSVQQMVLLLLLSGLSVHRCARRTGYERHTVRRWREWLRERSDVFSFFLRSRWPELGRCVDFASFWRNVIEASSLQQAMAWLDRDLTVP